MFTYDVLATVAATITIIVFVYGFFRNFKADLNLRMDRMEARIDTLEERMFLLATGKSLSQAILEEKLKQQIPKTNP